MRKIVVDGGAELSGEVIVGGSKNAALPISVTLSRIVMPERDVHQENAGGPIFVTVSGSVTRCRRILKAKACFPITDTG